VYSDHTATSFSRYTCKISFVEEHLRARSISMLGLLYLHDSWMIPMNSEFPYKQSMLGAAVLLSLSLSPRLLRALVRLTDFIAI